MPSEPPIYYLDACILIDLIETPPDQEPAKTLWSVFEAAEKGQCQLVTSTITIIEVLWAKEAELDQKKLDPEVQRVIDYLWHPTSSPIRLVEAHELIMREALAMLRKYVEKEGWSRTKGRDGVHLVTAQREGVHEFWSTDRGMPRWEPELGFKVCAPHYEPPQDESPGATDDGETLFDKDAEDGTALKAG